MNDHINTMIEQYNDTNLLTQQVCQLAYHSSNYKDLLELFQSIAENSGGEVYEGYSGRGMYGHRCWGVTGSLTEIIETAARHGLTGAKSDSFGYDSIVYWPDVEYNAPEEIDESEEDEDEEE